MIKMSKKFYDCVWLGTECMDCRYRRKMTKADKKPDCPKGFDPRWRIIDIK